ncbi:MAG: lipid A biosynthesis acyltransferase [Halomonadaceae bacterium]|nr:MAG: lipid A biosynthesis acyltransferase [Halomonadaceae bacterium]
MKALRVRTLRGVLYLFSRLPFAWGQALGAFFGRLAWWLRAEARKVTETNLGVAFPEISDEERHALARSSMLDTGRTMAEIAYMWERPVPECLSLIKEVEGQHLVDEALAEEKGLLLLAPHLGCWELAGLYFSCRFSMAALYEPPHVAELEAYMSKVRSRSGSELVRADRRGVLRLFTILREGGVVGILPDQNPRPAGGEFAPFFGVNILTMKLASKLVAKTGARTLITWAQRLPNGAGFRLVIREVDERVYGDDLVTSVAGINASVEQAVRGAPSQYQWEYKRFKRRPKGEPHLYDEGRNC